MKNSRILTISLLLGGTILSTGAALAQGVPFSQIDRNDDGQLDRGELARSFGAPSAGALLDQADRDGSGGISLSEARGYAEARGGGDDDDYDDDDDDDDADDGWSSRDDDGSRDDDDDDDGWGDDDGDDDDDRGDDAGDDDGGDGDDGDSDGDGDDGDSDGDDGDDD